MRPDTNRSVLVTRHAQDRWRERVGGPCSAGLIARAVREARFLPKGEPLPFPRKPRSVYYYHAAYKCWLVVEPLSETACRVVTVITETWLDLPGLGKESP